MQKINIYTNKGSKAKDAMQFAIYCLENNIDMMKLPDSELMRLKAEWNKTHFNQNQWRPTEQEIVEAEDSKSARKLIKETILEKELRKDEHILLSIIEIKEDTPYLLEMFEPKICAYCGNTFTFANNEYYGQYCCRACYEQAKLQQRKDDNEVFFSSDWCESYPVIYRIYDKKNNKNYIGQTIRAFTLRWGSNYSLTTPKNKKSRERDNRKRRII